MWLEHLLTTNNTDSAQKQAEFEEKMQTTIPLGSHQTVAELGEAVLYLVTAPNVTGVSLTVAGGFEMN